MTRARIAPLEPPYPPGVAADFEKLMPPGMEPLRLFRTLAHNPRVLGRVRRGGLLDRGSIALREREIVILRACGRCGCEYEWGVHVAAFAGAARLDEAQVASTATGGPDDACWAETEALLLRLVDALHDTAAVSDALWDALAKHWKPEQLVELLLLAGLYHAISFATNALRVELETGAPRFPGSSSGGADGR